MLGCAQQVAPAFVSLADNLVAARTLRLVGANRALLRGRRSARGCALRPRHEGQEQDQNEHFVFPDSSLLELPELALRAHARSESRQTPPRRSWLLVVGIRPLAPARSAAKNCAQCRSRLEQLASGRLWCSAGSAGAIYRSAVGVSASPKPGRTLAVSAGRIAEFPGTLFAQQGCRSPQGVEAGAGFTRSVLVCGPQE